ncbi:MAG: hypothetical protein K2X01_01640 [Cyanobacteria bacterium]|nr:hypothetical protein [Cyanobacteriota bacterium]
MSSVINHIPVDVLHAFWQECERLLLASQSEVQVYIEQAIQAVQSHAKEHVPYYRNLTPFPEAWPTLSKYRLQQTTEDFWAMDVDASDCLLWQTSGSTGEPTRFLVDAWGQTVREVSLLLSLSIAGVSLPHLKASISTDTVMIRLSSSEGLQQWHRPLPLLDNCLLQKFAVFEHPECDVDSVIEKILSLKPPCLAGDPQAFEILLSHWRVLYPEQTHCPYPVLFLSNGANVLSEPLRQKLEAFFGLAVSDCYAMAETSVIASQCPQGSFHVHIPLNILESNNESSENPSAPLWVTHFPNAAMPLIRYETGDWGNVSTKSDCHCGLQWPILHTFEGRQRRFLMNSSGDPVSPSKIIPLLNQLPVAQYQLIQKTATDFELRYRIQNQSILNPSTEKASSDLDQGIKTALQLALSQAINEPAMTLAFSGSEQHLGEPGKKFQDIVVLGF